MSDFELAEPYQAELISVAYLSPANFTRVQKAIGGDSSVFSNPQQKWLWDLAASTIAGNGEIPSPGLVAQEAGASFSGEEFGDLILLHHDIVRAQTQIMAPLAIIDRAVELGELHRYKQVIKQHERLVADGRYAEAKRLMESRSWVQEGSRISRFRERRVNNGYDDFDKFMADAIARRDDPQGFKLSTGIRELDARLDGGLALGELALVIGWTGRGKSTLTINMVDSFLRQGRGGLFIASEMRDQLILAKIFARSTHIPQNDIYVYRFGSPEQERAFMQAMELRRQRFKGLLRVEQLGIESMNRESITRAFADAYEVLKDLSWGIVDTLDHCELLPEFLKNPVRGFGSNANWLAGFADNSNIAMIYTTQSNKEGADVTELKHAANHSEAIRVSQVAMTINHADVTDEQPDLDPKDDFEQMMVPPSTNGQLRIDLLKARTGQPGPIPITTDLAMSYMGDKIMDAYEELGQLEALDGRPLLELA